MGNTDVMRYALLDKQIAEPFLINLVLTDH